MPKMSLLTPYDKEMSFRLDIVQFNHKPFELINKLKNTNILSCKYFFFYVKYKCIVFSVE